MRRRTRGGACPWRPEEGPAVPAGEPVEVWGRLACFEAVSRAGWLYLLPTPAVGAHPCQLPGAQPAPT